MRGALQSGSRFVIPQMDEGVAISQAGAHKPSCYKVFAKRVQRASGSGAGEMTAKQQSDQFPLVPHPSFCKDALQL